MAGSLHGKRIVIAGSRKTVEMSTIIEKQGGIPIIRSLQGIVVLAEKEVEHDLRTFIDNGSDWVIFTTGIGLQALLDQSEQLGFDSTFLNKIKSSKVAIRGYKTLALLKKLGILPIAVDHDGTTEGLIQALESFDFTGQRVTVQLHGEPVPSLVDFLESKGAVVRTILPYTHIPPENHVLELLCQEMAEGSVDAICFTTAVQVRYFFQYIRNNGSYQQIQELFATSVLAAAVGRVTAEAIREEGVSRVLVPQSERMGALIVELSRYYQ
ncbi:uroporphyrinogen-III synthase [Paenibacillus eucommiae]|uniref:Uroporphyrinogen-III synthase n=1 Tax=Paenibacillus eucommiae TaxID=1355755 RepID=A0ABS4J6V8_9BACL|nr:uroporphyrinogen-III synthase [Paenibacillus eucommiae]MBP1995552.1 uroporphyrinogen-III synthase [Paenibacillus eucommiae]